MTTREGKERKLARRREWAQRRREKATKDRVWAQEILQRIPPGQPILSGHHSEKQHRRDLLCADAAMARAAEHDRMAEEHDEIADGIEEELSYNIYTDDVDAVERLEKRIAELEAEAASGPRRRNIRASIRRLKKRIPEARVYARVREGESRCAARGQEDRNAGRTMMTPEELVAWAAGEELIRPDADPGGKLATRYCRAYTASYSPKEKHEER